MIEAVKNINKSEFSMESYGQQNFYSKQEEKENDFEEVLEEEIDKLEEDKKEKTLTDIIDAYTVNNSKNIKLRDELIK